MSSVSNRIETSVLLSPVERKDNTVEEDTEEDDKISTCADAALKALAILGGAVAALVALSPPIGQIVVGSLAIAGKVGTSTLAWTMLGLGAVYPLPAICCCASAIKDESDLAVVACCFSGFAMVNVAVAICSVLAALGFLKGSIAGIVAMSGGGLQILAFGVAVGILVMGCLHGESGNP